MENMEITQPVVTIGFGADGQFLVTAPFGELVKCYGLLEAARDVIREQNMKIAEQKATGLVAATQKEVLNFQRRNGAGG